MTGLAYLATPYSRFNGGIYLAFEEAAKLAAILLTTGTKVFSPIAHSHPIAIYGKIDPYDHSIWLPYDKAMMDVCECLIVAHLQGWEESYGIAEEVKIFEAARKPIFDLDPVSMIMTRRRHDKPPRERYEGISDKEISEKVKEYLDPHSGSSI